MPTGLSAPVFGVNCLSPSSLANCQLLSPFVSLSDSRPLTTSGHAEISSPKPFVWFRAKTDKRIVCLADHLHSVTGGGSPATWDHAISIITLTLRDRQVNLGIPGKMPCIVIQKSFEINMISFFELVRFSSGAKVVVSLMDNPNSGG